MATNATLTEDDEGKNVIDSAGNQVGRVVAVENGRAHVDPDPGLADTVRSKLGWGDRDEETYRLDSSNIATVSENEIHLSR